MVASTALAFAPPLSSARPRSPSPGPSIEPYLSTTAGELAFFRALIQHRPVGLDKHWEMIGVALHLRDHVGEDREVKIGQGELWAKYRELYDEETLQTTWEGEQMDAMEDDNDEADATETGGDDQSDSAWINARFPRKDFTLLVPPSKLTPSLDESLFASLADRIASRATREEDSPPSPPSEPVREFSLELPEEDEVGEEEQETPKGRGARGKGRTTTTTTTKQAETESPRKKRAKVAEKDKVEPAEGDEVSGSDLSELEDDEDEVSGGGEEEEGDDGAEDGSSAVSEGEGEEYQEEGDGKKADAASAIRSLPSSKRKRTTRSTSAAPSSEATSHHTNLSAAEVKKEKAKLAMRARRAKIKAEKEKEKEKEASEAAAEAEKEQETTTAVMASASKAKGTRKKR